MAFQFIPFLTFAVAASVTPGPNNVMVAAAAANFGIRAALPMILGIALGFCLMVLVMGLGLAGPLADYPQVHRVLRWVGIAWMLYLAWKIGNSGMPDRSDAKAPLGIVGASLFQWVNPKAWLLALAVATTWTSATEPVAPQVAQMALVFFIVSLPSNMVWAWIGVSAARLLHSASRLRWFNIVMAVLLALSMLPLALEE